MPADPRGSNSSTNSKPCATRNTQLWAWLEQTVDFPETRRQQFTITAAAMGLSRNQIGVLLAIILGAVARPSRSALHRIVQAAGRRAGQVLAALDRQCRALILVGCLDEIFFHGRPVLVGVEPASRVWFLGTRAADRSGTTWLKALRPWTALEFLVADAGKGLQNGIALLQQERRAVEETVPENGLDVFHTTQEAQRVLRAQWQRVERLWEQAETAEAAARHAGQQGQDGRGPAARLRAAWQRAVAAFQAYERGAAGWNPGPARARGVSAGGPPQRSGRGATADRRGAAAVGWTGLVQGADVPGSRHEPDILGSVAPAVGAGRAGPGVADGVDPVMVAAAAAAASRRRHSPWR